MKLNIFVINICFSYVTRRLMAGNIVMKMFLYIEWVGLIQHITFCFRE